MLHRSYNTFTPRLYTKMLVLRCRLLTPHFHILPPSKRKINNKSSYIGGVLEQGKSPASQPATYVMTGFTFFERHIQRMEDIQ